MRYSISYHFKNPVLQALVAPDRWLLWLGVLFIVCVYYFPSGIVGRLRR